MPEQQTSRGLWACPLNCTAPCALECDAAPLKTEAGGECARACPHGCHDDRVTWADRDLIGCACGALHWPEETAAAGYRSPCEPDPVRAIADFALGVWRAHHGARKTTDLPSVWQCTRMNEPNAGNESAFKDGCICPECSARVHDDFDAWQFGMGHDESDSPREWCDFCAPFGPAHPLQFAACEPGEAA